MVADYTREIIGVGQVQVKVIGGVVEVWIHIPGVGLFFLPLSPDECYEFAVVLMEAADQAEKSVPEPTPDMAHRG